MLTLLIRPALPKLKIVLVIKPMQENLENVKENNSQPHRNVPSFETQNPFSSLAQVSDDMEPEPPTEHQEVPKLKR